MKLVGSDTMRAMEMRAMKEYGVCSLTLMENAGRGCMEIIDSEFGSDQGQRAIVLAGSGNNGGDGYVIARLLRTRGWHVMTFVLSPRDRIRGDARVNLDLLMEDSVVFCPEQGELAHYKTVIRDADVLVDALLGTGLKDVVRNNYADAVEIINSSGKPVVSVDIPSGIDAENGRILGCAVKADLTVTFAVTKIGHVLYPGIDHTGRLHLVDIGIPGELIAEAETCDFLDAAEIKPFIGKRDRTAHKGSFGHCLIVAGSTGKTGAAAMVANSALRTGAGLITLAVPASLHQILEIKTTEVMTFPLPDEGKGFLTLYAKSAIQMELDGKDALALGPGLSRSGETGRLVRELIEEIQLPMVVDADALVALADDVSVLLRKKSPAVILTPHPGEMARLIHQTIDVAESDRIGTAREFAARFKVYLVLKGARTIIASPDGRIAVNGSGNPGMASGGMGDVLVGVLAALLGQGLDPFTACKVGVFVHGHAADLVAADKGEIGMSALDVQETLPYAFKELAG